MFREALKKLKDRFKEIEPCLSREDMVSYLVLHTASLALEKGQYVEFAPIKGTCGNIKLFGNSLPTFTYTVFEKEIMEFVDVRVELSKPDRIEFFSRVVSTDQDANGKDVETKDRYKEPFNKLAGHLTKYFPFPRDVGVPKHGLVQQTQISLPG